MKSKLATIWRILTLPCSESTRLMSASLDEKLPWTERVAFRLHAVSCGSCRRFFKQIRFLHSAADRYRRPPDDSPDAPPRESATLSPETRQRIERALQDAKGPND